MFAAIHFHIRLKLKKHFRQTPLQSEQTHSPVYLTYSFLDCGQKTSSIQTKERTLGLLPKSWQLQMHNLISSDDPMWKSWRNNSSSLTLPTLQVVAVCKNNLYCLGLERSPHRLCQDRRAFFFRTKRLKTKSPSCGFPSWKGWKRRSSKYVKHWKYSVGWMVKGQRAAKPGCNPDESAGHREVEAKVRWVILPWEWHLSVPGPADHHKELWSSRSSGPEPGSLFHTSWTTGLFKAEVTWGISTAFVCALWGISCVTTSHTSWVSAWRKKKKIEFSAQHNNISTSDLCKVNNSDGVMMMRRSRWWSCSTQQARGSERYKVRAVRL